MKLVGMDASRSDAVLLLSVGERPLLSTLIYFYSLPLPRNLEDGA